jgi:predicted MFS family arabinose efflux permease
MSVVALCAFGAFLFVTTRYLQDTRGLSPLGAGLALLPLGLVVLLVAPSAGRVVGHRGPRLPLVVAGAALSLAGIVQLAVAPGSPIALLLVLFALVGLFLGAVNPPMTATAVAGMPGSMAGVAAALVSSGRQTGTTLGVAVAGSAAGSIGWLVLAAGAVLLALALLSTGTRARASADRAAALFGPAQAP